MNLIFVLISSLVSIVIAYKDPLVAPGRSGYPLILDNFDFNIYFFKILALHLSVNDF